MCSLTADGWRMPSPAPGQGPVGLKGPCLIRSLPRRRARLIRPAKCGLVVRTPYFAHNLYCRASFQRTQAFAILSAWTGIVGSYWLGLAFAKMAAKRRLSTFVVPT